MLTHQVLFGTVASVLPFVIDLLVWDICKYRDYLLRQWNANRDIIDGINVMNSMILYTVSLFTAGFLNFDKGGWILVIIAFISAYGAFALSMAKSPYKNRYRRIAMVLSLAIVIGHAVFVISSGPTS